MSNGTFLIKSGRVVDPLSRKVFTGDIRISAGKIAEVAENITPAAGEQIIDAAGKVVMPGLVDMHVHISGSDFAQYMMAKAGVTTALDVAVPEAGDQYVSRLSANGCGMNIGYLRSLVPGKTLTSDDPDETELAAAIDIGLKEGAMGVKILGGHTPLTRRATAAAIRLAHERKAWICFHTGTRETNGDVRGLLEAIELSNGMPLHIAHINSYCRGGVCGPLKEAELAIEALKKAPNCRTESYLALFNGTNGYIDENNVPYSRVTGNELRRGGYEVSVAGMEAALRDGIVKVNYRDEKRKEIVLLEPEEGLKYYRQMGGKVLVSFYANSPVSSIPIALAKKDDGSFVVDALGTDGGSIPRNLTLKQGLHLVRFGALTLPDFAAKASLNPARLMGFNNRGYLAAGAAADIIVVDMDAAEAEYVFANGKLICEHGNICGTGCNIFTSPTGENALRQYGVPYEVNVPEWLNTEAAAPVKPVYKRTIGILGGLGPFATVDLFNKLVKATPAVKDQEHPHTIVDNACHIPDRNAALLHGGESPVPEMLAAARRLQSAGADFLIMPCNTAHAFLPEVEPYIQIPFLNMIRVAAEHIRENLPQVKKVGLLGTSGTVNSGVYAREIEAIGAELLVPDAAGQEEVMDAIYSPEHGVKAGHTDIPNRKFVAEAMRLIERGAGAIILGCTEIPLAVGSDDLPVPAIDATQLLAEKAVKIALSGTLPGTGK